MTHNDPNLNALPADYTIAFEQKNCITQNEILALQNASA